MPNSHPDLTIELPLFVYYLPSRGGIILNSSSWPTIRNSVAPPPTPMFLVPRLISYRGLSTPNLLCGLVPSSLLASAPSESSFPEEETAGRLALFELFFGGWFFFVLMRLPPFSTGRLCGRKVCSTVIGVFYFDPVSASSLFFKSQIQRRCDLNHVFRLIEYDSAGFPDHFVPSEYSPYPFSFLNMFPAPSFFFMLVH